MESTKPIMNIEEVARYLGVSTATIYRYVKQGKIPASRVGKFWRFRKEKIDAWLERQENVEKG
jgi:excisionase family DNA binding protein